MSRHRRIRGLPPQAFSFKQRIVPTRPEIPRRSHMESQISATGDTSGRCTEGLTPLEFQRVRNCILNDHFYLLHLAALVWLCNGPYVYALFMHIWNIMEPYNHPMSRSPRRTTNLQEHKTWLRTLQAGWIETLPEKDSPYNCIYIYLYYIYNVL